MCIIRRLSITLLILALTSPAWAMKVKVVVNTQGLLTDDTGTPLDGTFGLTLRIYATETSSTPLAVITKVAVPVAGGLFNVAIGDESPLGPDLFVDPNETAPEVERWLEFQVESNPPIAPRIPLHAVPYAVAAYRLAGDISTAPALIRVQPPDPVTPSDSTEGGIVVDESGDPGAYIEAGKMLLRKKPGRVKYSSLSMSSVDPFTGDSAGAFVAETDSSASALHMHSFGKDNMRRSELDLRTGQSNDEAALSLRAIGVSTGDSGMITMSSSQTREHILLSRQVGVPHAMEMQVDSSGGSYAVLSNGDSAIVMDARSDKRKQSLYFPEDALPGAPPAIQLTVDGTSAELRMSAPNVAGGGTQDNAVITNDGSMSLAGNATIGGQVDLTTQAGALIVPRLTTPERDALSAVNGMIIYNVTTNQFNFFENFAWVTK